MKNLEVSLVVRADNTNHAESIAMRELLELAKVIAKRNAGTMGQGSGSATPLASDAYQVNATVSIDSKGNVNDIIKDIQNVWMHKPEIVHSMFTVEEEKQEKEANPMEDMEQSWGTHIPPALNPQSRARPTTPPPLRGMFDLPYEHLPFAVCNPASAW